MTINNLCCCFICFIVFSFIGWCYECLFYSIQLKKPVNSGFLHGCICPVYGIGGMLLAAFAGEVSNCRILFITGVVVCSAIEYFISWLLEYLFNARWWDYSDWPMNINGRVCVISMIGFGCAAIIGTKYIIPITFGAVGAMEQDKMMLLAGLMAILLIADIIYTLHNIDETQDKPWFIEEHSKLMEEHGAKLGEKIENLRNLIKK